MVDLEVMCKWQDALLGPQCIWLNTDMFYLLKTKDDCRTELLFISCQQSDRNLERVEKTIKI